MDFVERTALESQDATEIVIVSAADLGQNPQSENFIFLGDEQAGKTTFCKQAYLEYHKNGSVGGLGSNFFSRVYETIPTQLA